MKDIFLSAQWKNLIMVNYEVDADVLIPYLPRGVELDYYNNKTYVSLVGFMFANTRIFNLPIPFFGTFEEINLRFYVKRVVDGRVKRGVVFINETVPYKVVAWLANKLYRENYISIPTKNSIKTGSTRQVKYQWKMNKQWNHLEVVAKMETEEMQHGSMEEFIFEHYFGFTKINNQISQEYRIHHPRWLINKVSDYSVRCDFENMYGKNFSNLSNVIPDSVFMAEGSAVSIEYKRTTF